jgi:hypothetical protein
VARSASLEPGRSQVYISTVAPRRRIRLASVAGELAARIARLSFANLRRLDTSHGCQDHTVLPYATSPFVWRAVIAHGKTRPAIPIARPALSRPPQPGPTFVTIAIRPSCGPGWREF